MKDEGRNGGALLRATHTIDTLGRLAVKGGRRLGRRARKLAGAWYYRYLFDRPYPLVEAAGRVVQGWERRDRRGDTPQERTAWEHQYAEGRWDFMAGPREIVRYNAVIDLLLAHAPGGAVLDVGCGEGILFQRFRPHGYRRYVGLDISATAIARLAAAEDAHTSFLCADAESYRPTGLFDAILFNETLYYLQRPLAAVEGYLGALAPGGVVIVSTMLVSPRGMAILRGLKRRLALREEVTVDRGDFSYLCSVLAPRPTRREG